MITTANRELTRPRLTKNRNSGTTSTTGGTTISTTLSPMNGSRPGKRMRASGYAASADTIAATTTLAVVMIRLLATHVSSCPSRNASWKFWRVGSVGGRNWLSRYSLRVLNDVMTMK